LFLLVLEFFVQHPNRNFAHATFARFNSNSLKAFAHPSSRGDNFLKVVICLGDVQNCAIATWLVTAPPV